VSGDNDQSPLAREDIRRALVEALSPRVREVGIAPEQIEGDFDILGSGVVDSLGFVELLLAVEDALGRPVELERLSFGELTSLDGLVEQLHGLQVGAPGGAG
jgi:acyl carrier protein